MKRLISVELLEEHLSVSLYTVRFNDEEETLFDKFLAQFSSKEFETDIDKIVSWLDKIGTTGALERYFRPEGHPKVKAIPIDTSNLRLYCFRINDRILVLGGGKNKNVKAFQDDPELHQYVTTIKKVGIKLLRYIEQNKVVVNERELSGKLSFEIDI